jgi:hypothetical protein
MPDSSVAASSNSPFGLPRRACVCLSSRSKTHHPVFDSASRPAPEAGCRGEAWTTIEAVEAPDASDLHTSFFVSHLN